MSRGSRYRAWRFVFPAVDTGMEDAGLALSAQGGIAMVSDADSVRQAILLLVATRPGERVMRPDYGCPLYRLAFEPNDDTTAGLAMHYVRQALERWEPRIRVLAIDAGRSDEHPSRLLLELHYRLKSEAHAQTLGFAVDLQTGRAAP
jgi:phage baseplate assembly protein W